MGLQRAARDKSDPPRIGQQQQQLALTMIQGFTEEAVLTLSKALEQEVDAEMTLLSHSYRLAYAINETLKLIYLTCCEQMNFDSPQVPMAPANFSVKLPGCPISNANANETKLSPEG